MTVLTLKLVLAARRPRRRPERRVTHMVKEVTESVGAREEDPRDAIRWRQIIRCDDPCGERQKRESTARTKAVGSVRIT